MTREQIIQLILTIAKVPDAFEQLEKALYDISVSQLSEYLNHCGIIPEMFTPGSSEEKLWAKHCDILLAKSLSSIGIKAQVLRMQGNSADVFAQGKDFTLVGDAKAFRLSRTAKNQKDFKVTALNEWRRTNTFACLVAPLYQYPTKNSQIYEQAEQHNVVLMAYVHLRFLLDHPPLASWHEFWQFPRTLVPTQSSQLYWDKLETLLIEITGRNVSELEGYKQAEISSTKALGINEIIYWESVIQSYHQLSKEEAIRRLIKAEKIESKIRTIRRAISHDIP